MGLVRKIGFFAAGVLFIVGASLIAFYATSGSYVDEDGVLVEEFSALALGTFVLIAAITVGVISSIISIVRLFPTRKP